MTIIDENSRHVKEEGKKHHQVEPHFAPSRAVSDRFCRKEGLRLACGSLPQGTSSGRAARMRGSTLQLQVVPDLHALENGIGQLIGWPAEWPSRGPYRGRKAREPFPGYSRPQIFGPWLWGSVPRGGADLGLEFISWILLYPAVVWQEKKFFAFHCDAFPGRICSG